MYLLDAGPFIRVGLLCLLHSLPAFYTHDPAKNRRVMGREKSVTLDQEKEKLQKEAGTTDDVGPGLATHQVLLKVYISLSPESCAMMQVLDYSFYR